MVPQYEYRYVFLKKKIKSNAKPWFIETWEL